MGNAASLNENINSKISKLESIDINFSKPYFKNSSNNKCSACQAGINILTLKRRKCTQCLEHYCVECVTHYKGNHSPKFDCIMTRVVTESIYICYRCQIFISPKLNWSELMSLKSKDLVWYLDRKNISHPHCTDKEQLADIILERFMVGRDQAESDLHRQRLTINMENLLNSEQEPCSSSDVVPSDFDHMDEASVMSSINQSRTDIDHIESQLEVSSTTFTPPPSYHAALEGGYSAFPGQQKCERVNIEEIEFLRDIDDLSVKQLKDLLAYNKVDYKGCVERYELVTRVQRLWTAYNDDREHLTHDNSEVKECIICMDQPVDCVLIECGHMLSCVRCGSRLAECPLCRQNVVRCIRVFSAH